MIASRSNIHCFKNDKIEEEKTKIKTTKIMTCLHFDSHTHTACCEGVITTNDIRLFI